MIFDKQLMFADDDDFDAVAVSVDLGFLQSSGIGPGSGNPILINVRGKDLVADGGLDYKVVVTGSNDNSTFFAEMEVQMGEITAALGGITFGLSSAVARYIKVVLFGFNAGTWTAGVVLQHNT